MPGCVYDICYTLQAFSSGLLPRATAEAPQLPAPSACDDSLVNLVAEARASRYEEQSQPALAAACFLAHGQAQ